MNPTPNSDAINDVPVVDDLDMALADKLFNHLESQINLADNKANMAMVANTILLGAVASFSVASLPKITDAAAPLALRLSGIVTASVLFLLLLSLWYALQAVKPRLTKTDGLGEALFFFGNIISRPAADFIREFTNRTEQDAVRIILQECYIKAGIIKRKFALSRLSLNFTLSSLVLWAIAVVLLVFGS